MARLEAGSGQQRRLVELPQDFAGKLFEERIPAVRLSLAALLPGDVMDLEQGQAGQEGVLCAQDALDPVGAVLVLASSAEESRT